MAALWLVPTLHAQPLPGQIVRDSEHPSWLKRHGGEHVFLVGPGDPEDFLYRGERLPSGRRVGDQAQIIQRLAKLGGNTLYVQAVRSHGGDGASDHNPFTNSDPAQGIDPDILEQWSEWIELADAAGVVICFFIYDDSARIWDLSEGVGAEERAFVEALANALEEHPNLIVFVSEESEEARSPEIARELAQIFRDADDHDHLLGDHHWSGNTFVSWNNTSVLEVFGMQFNVEGDQIHHEAVAAHIKGTLAGPQDFGWLAIYAEAFATSIGDTTTRRHFIWDAALGGLQSMVFGVEVAGTPDEQLEQCRVLQEFMEDTDFWTMSPADQRAAGGTRWVLGNANDSIIAYSRDPIAPLGLDGLPATTYDLLWVDCVTGARATEFSVHTTSGTNYFTRPAGIGAECAVSVRRSWVDLGAGHPGLFGQPHLQGTGPLESGSNVSLQVTDALPLAPSTLVIGLENAQLPFKGGTLLPDPVWLVPFLIGVTGNASLQAVWPDGLPAGVPLYVQVWMAEGLGFSATNAVVETSN
ncbi:MAG: hypothetical protein DHS20C15_30160 [Planctomycetota bacterium]|nr:MAG: hypothetical protein DHS20C15_30160 [Planctomycetota bacterium]